MTINATQLAGLLAFVPAMSFAGMASVRPLRRGERRLWVTIAIIYALFAIEVVAGVRYILGRTVTKWLIDVGIYSDRRPAQAGAIVVVIALMSWAAFALMWASRTACLKIAACATVSLVSLFIVETVSFHAIDGILYRSAGPVLLIAWAWLLFGWISAGAAAVERIGGVIIRGQ